MANYTSTYTGTQIDAAVTKVNGITSTPAQINATVTKLGQIASTPNQIDTVVSKVNGINYTAAQINTGVANGINVPALIEQVKLAMYPIGSIYINVDGKNPATFIGGTWQRVTDRFLLAAGTTYQPGTTGGAATVALNVDQMPAHTHVLTGFSRDAKDTDTCLIMQGDGNLVMYSMKGGEWHATWAASWMSSPYMNIDATGGSNYYHWGLGFGQTTIDSRGGGWAHENMPPYLAVYVWQRTA